MPGNTFGHLFTFTSFGESHGEALGVVIDGFPSGIKIEREILESMLRRRAPGQSSLTTPRKEEDGYEILSGVFNGYSTGTPIGVIVRNNNQRSSDYSTLEHIYRPGHADYTYRVKYGIRDYRGGGRSSGRETVARVIAGAFAMMALERYSITVTAGLVGAGKVRLEDYQWNPPFNPPLYAPDCSNKALMEEEINNARRDGDSVGSVIECRINNVPAGLGEPVFDKLDAALSHAVFSLGGVKGFEIGNGFSAFRERGSSNNDEIIMKDGKPAFLSNNAGGILGGISNGDEIVFTSYFKPTPSISKEQRTITDNGEETLLSVPGRHDPSIGPRAVVVVEAMAASVILDFLLMDRAERGYGVTRQ